MAFLAAILFSRSLVGPLEVLTKAMKRVSAGFLDSQIEVNTSDEISVLASSFNGMIKDLKSSRQKLIEMNSYLEESEKNGRNSSKNKTRPLKKLKKRYCEPLAWQRWVKSLGKQPMKY
ncbi:MAG: HAMP domain-containing protein [Bdellovibrionales bacterium]